MIPNTHRIAQLCSSNKTVVWWGSTQHEGHSIRESENHCSKLIFTDHSSVGFLYFVTFPFCVNCGAFPEVLGQSLGDMLPGTDDRLDFHTLMHSCRSSSSSPPRSRTEEMHFPSFLLMPLASCPPVGQAIVDRTQTWKWWFPRLTIVVVETG